MTNKDRKELYRDFFRDCLTKRERMPKFSMKTIDSFTAREESR